MSWAYKVVNSPIGMLKLVASDKGLAAILWKNDNPRHVRLEDLVEEPLHPLLVRTDNELKDYFAGNRRTFSVPLDMRGHTFKSRYGRPCWASPLERHVLTATSRSSSEIAPPRELWERLTVAIRSPSSYPATESFERLAA